MTIKESNIPIKVRDLDKSILFYEFIGLTVKSRWNIYYAHLTAPGLVIGLHPTQSVGVICLQTLSTAVLLAVSISATLQILINGNEINNYQNL